MSVVALMKSPAGAELWGDQSRLVGLPGQGVPTPITVHLSAQDIPHCDTGAFVQHVCLAPWAVWLILHHSWSVCFFGEGEALGWGRSGTKSLCGP